jgi:hypothetical protein
MCGALFGFFVFAALFTLAFQFATPNIIPWSVFWKGAAIGFGMGCGVLAILVFAVWVSLR